MLWALGECEAAGREFRLAAELDPLSPIIVTETALPTRAPAISTARSR